MRLFRPASLRWIHWCYAVWWCAVGTSSAGAVSPEAVLQTLVVPPGFQVTLAAAPDVVRFPMFACFDDQGRLYVAESSGKDLYAGLQKLSRDCRVIRLEDTDRDGVFDRSDVFVKDVTFPMGLAWREGRLYLADPPDLVVLTEDPASPGRPRREVVQTGFGHTDNGSLHGVTFGPDGGLYFTMGSPDGWRLPVAGGRWAEGRTGGFFRSRPGGGPVDIISRGFENLVEVEFLPGGEVIGTDNWYQEPADGYRDALVDCVPGGLYPFRTEEGTPLPRTGLTLPPVVLLPAVAHSGLTRLRGSGFPPDWRDSLFVAEHNTRKVSRHALRPHGSTFASDRFDFVTGSHPDFHPADVLEDGDGSLLVVDTGGWYVEHCPTGRIRDSRAPGGIFRVRWLLGKRPEDPWGRLLSEKDWDAGAASRFLEDPRPVVADRALGWLVEHRQVAELRQVLLSPAKPMEARARSVWGLYRVGGDQALASLRSALAEKDPTVVCAAARALGLAGDTAADTPLAELLKSAVASVRRAAAEALAGCGTRISVGALTTALERASDAFERHACVAALLKLADEDAARRLLGSPSPPVRQAALRVLDQLTPARLRFADLESVLGDPDAGLRETARSLLRSRPEWASDAAPWIGARLKQAGAGGSPDGSEGVFELMRTFQSQPAVRDLVGRVIDPGGEYPESARAMLWREMATWSRPGPEEAWLARVPAEWARPAVREAALRFAMAFPRVEWAEPLKSLLRQEGLGELERLLAMRALPRGGGLDAAEFGVCLGAIERNGPVEHVRLSAEILGRSALTPQQRGQLLALYEGGARPIQEGLLGVIAREAGPELRPRLVAMLLDRLRSGWMPAPAMMEKLISLLPTDSAERAVLTAAWKTNDEGRRKRLDEFRPLLTGGDAARGREVFGQATCANCHRVGNEGGLAGPDLTRIGAIRSPGDLLESILFPSSSFAQGYVPHVLRRKDQDELTGNLVRESEEWVELRDSGGVVQRLARAEIEEIRPQAVSMMPEGLEQLMTREQFRDLLAFLQDLQ